MGIVGTADQIEGGRPLATEPAVLTLIGWGDEATGAEPLSVDHPDGARLMAQVNAMTTCWHPRNVAMFLTNLEDPKNGNWGKRFRSFGKV